MKKILFITIFIMLFLLSGYIGEPKVTIPKEAIRLRVIPSSNSEYDQYIKNKVKMNLQNNIVSLLEPAEDISDARLIINENLKEINSYVKDTLTKENYSKGYNVNFGYNYFPQKKFKGVTYKEGYYESLVITLGNGLGSNWWCVLFPPLCLMEAEETDNITYTTYVSEIINKYKKTSK